MLKNGTRKKISILKSFQIKKKEIKKMRIKYDIKNKRGWNCKKKISNIEQIVLKRLGTKPDMWKN